MKNNNTKNVSTDALRKATKQAFVKPKDDNKKDETQKSIRVYPHKTRPGIWVDYSNPDREYWTDQLQFV